MARKVTPRHENQIEGLMEDIKCGFCEDFQFTSHEQAMEALDILKAKVNALTYESLKDGIVSLEPDE